MTTAPAQRVFAPTATFPPRPVLGISVPGWPIIGLFVVATAGLTAGSLALLGPWGWIIAAVCGLLTLWCVWFFRDPARAIPADAGLMVSPADGVVCMIVQAAPSDLDPAHPPVTRVSVFMNVFNVHVNRAPIEGTAESLRYHPGKFFNASFDKASTDNERLAMGIRLRDGRLCVCVQIAGLVARRIVCQVRNGTALGRGDRYGLIRFGSRVDVYLPPGFVSAVKVGQRMVAGETIIARDSAAGGAAGSGSPVEHGAARGTA
ncbi:MAG: phosphatidylserine decarboxylase [Phycisphaerales bacterium]|nr:phosphatidylserine decarboxylase [Phycisphaerales bacterium]